MSESQALLKILYSQTIFFHWNEITRLKNLVFNVLMAKQENQNFFVWSWTQLQSSVFVSYIWKGFTANNNSEWVNQGCLKLDRTISDCIKHMGKKKRTEKKINKNKGQYYSTSYQRQNSVKSLYSNLMGQPSRQKNYSFLMTCVAVFDTSPTANWNDFHFSVGFYYTNNFSKHSHEVTVYMLWVFL